MRVMERALATRRDFLVPCASHFYRRPPVLVRGDGTFLYDTNGKRYLDCFAGATVMNAGHSNPAVIEPAIGQLRQLAHATSSYLTEPVLELARAVAELAPPGLRRTFFCTSSSEANEGAMMLAARATGRKEYVSLDGAFHGRTKAAVNANGLDAWRTDPFPSPDFHRVPEPRHPDSLPALERLLRKGTVAAVLAEPVQVSGGIVVPPDGYWAELRRLCTAYGTLLVADEVQTAWNRTGRWFATEHWGVVPDVVTVAKALGNGFPIAAYLTTDELAARAPHPGATFGGNPVSCRAALATLRFHQEKRLGERSEALGNHLRARLRAIQNCHPVISDVRGIGLMVAAELDVGANSEALTDAVLEHMKDAGYLLGKCGPGRNVFAFLPPLVVDLRDLDRMVDDLDRALASVP